MRRLVVALPALLAALSVPALAGTPADPEVTDLRGDVQHFGVPVPAGFEWSDIVAAWFERDGDTSITLRIEVTGAGGPPAQGEVGVTFRVGAKHFIAGWTVVPGLYSGGFVSEAEADGDVPATVQPAAAEASWTRGSIRVTVPLAALGSNATAGFLTEPNGWSESRATNGRMYRLDETAVGRPFVWAPQSVAPAPLPEGGDGTGRDAGAGAAVGVLALVFAGMAAQRTRAAKARQGAAAPAGRPR